MRPSAYGFGTLADGYGPFLKEDGETPIGFQPRMASVVMKAVQARHPSVGLPPPLGGSSAADGIGGGDGQPIGGAERPRWPAATMPCAGKYGDVADPSRAHSKAQVDPRLPGEAQRRALERMRAMAAATHASAIDGAATSALLREMYVAVSRAGMLRVPAAAAAAADLAAASAVLT